MVVITGATGNTGRPLAMALLEAGTPVRIISRSAKKAADLVAKGAELRIGVSDDAAFLSEAFAGATAVYAMIPPNLHTQDFRAFQMQHAEAITRAVQAAGVTHVVQLSSVGAHLEDGSGIILGLRRFEQMLDAVPDLHVLHLRPAYFMENIFGMIPTIKMFNMVGSPITPDLPLAMIATRDIAAHAARRLRALDFTGSSVQYLLGQRDLTFIEMVSILGPAIDKPGLRYQEFHYELFRGAMVQMGVSKSSTDLTIEFMKALNDGRIMSDVQRSVENTTPTSIEDFAPVFAHVYTSR